MVVLTGFMVEGGACVVGSGFTVKGGVLVVGSVFTAEGGACAVDFVVASARSFLFLHGSEKYPRVSFCNEK